MDLIRQNVANVVKEKEVLELLSKVEVDLRELAHESKTDKKKSRFSDMLSKGFTNLLDIRQRTKAVALVKRCSGFYQTVFAYFGNLINFYTGRLEP